MVPANCLPTRPKRFFVLLHDMAKQYYEMHGPERNLIQASEDLGSFVTVPGLDENGWCLPVQESQIQDARIAETLRELPSDTISEQNTGTGLG